MKDRVSLYPGRIKLTPVPDEENVYDMERADQPTQEGMALNKFNLLKDETAALFGLDENAVPDDVFRAINTAISGRAEIVAGSYKGTGTYGASNPNTLTFDFVPKLIIIFDNNNGAGLILDYDMTSGASNSSIGIFDLTWLSETYKAGGLVLANYLGKDEGDSSAVINGYSKRSADGKTLYWYCKPYSTSGNQATSSYITRAQRNQSGVTYRYIAIG